MVPLRGRPTLGFALGAPEAGETAGLRLVADVLDEPGCPALPPGLLGFFTRAAAHYQAPLGQALAWSLPAGLGGRDCALPAGRGESLAVVRAREGQEAGRPKAGSRAERLLARLREGGEAGLAELRQEFRDAASLVRRLEKAGWAAVSHRPLVKDLLGRPLMPEPRPEAFTDDQATALARLLPAVEQRRFEPFLLYGVTGSGKTEVYLAACEAALKLGRGALVLTPEIGLALRLEGLLRDRLGAEVVAVLHSGLSPAARRGQWRAIASGHARVEIGRAHV
jgi:primosomal protein N' (replication factor Y)